MSDFLSNINYCEFADVLVCNVCRCGIVPSRDGISCHLKNKHMTERHAGNVNAIACMIPSSSGSHPFARFYHDPRAHGEKRFVLHRVPGIAAVPGVRCPECPRFFHTQRSLRRHRVASGHESKTKAENVPEVQALFTTNSKRFFYEVNPLADKTKDISTDIGSDSVGEMLDLLDKAPDDSDPRASSPFIAWSKA